MIFRFPDKPTTSSVGVLDELVEGEWLAQTKYDGWRASIHWDGSKVTLTSREQKLLPASKALLDALAEVIHGWLAIPTTPVLLDGEWMGRRDKQPESVWIFDHLMHGSKWLGSNMTAIERWSSISSIARCCKGPVKLVQCVDRDYRKFFEASKRLPGAEGIVLKHKTSRFIGSVRGCVDNPMWLKVRWRDGEDGQRIIKEGIK